MEYKDTLENIDLENYTSTGVPKIVNILSILTFVGSGIAIISALLLPVILKFSSKAIDMTMAGGGGELSAAKLKQMEDTRALLELQQASMVPTIIVTVLGAALCIFGAMQMRKCKMDGFWIYVAGQVIPIVASAVLIGKAQFASAWSYVGLIIPIGFIVGYYLQKRFLTK